MQFFLLYYYKDLLMHVHLSCTIYYNIQALRNSKSSLLSAGGISYWERSALWPLHHPRGDSWHIPYFPYRLAWVKYHSIQLSWSWTLTATLRHLLLSVEQWYLNNIDEHTLHTNYKQYMQAILVLHSQWYMAQGHTPHVGNDHCNTRWPPIISSRASGLEV